MSEQQISDGQVLKQALKAVHGMYIQQQITVFNALKEEFGPQVMEVIRQANSREVCKTFNSLARQGGSNSIQDLVNVLWEPLRSKGYEFTVEQTGDGVQMHCLACPFAAMYRALGGAEWGYALYCAADEDLVQAFNPAIGFKRSQTLMEGHSCCDHFYFNRE